MLNQKQFGCLKFLAVNFNDTQVCKGETSKKTTIYTQLKTSRQINDIRDTSPDTENTTTVRIWVFTGRLSTNQSREF